MTDDRTDRAATPLRRRDRHLADEAWVDRFLAGAPIGHLALAPGGIPTIHAHNFWSDGAAIYSHGSQRGTLADLTADGPLPACFTITEHGRLLVADAAVDFGTEFAGVVAYGTFGRVEDQDEKRRALDGLMSKYAPSLRPGRDYRPTDADDMRRTVVYRFDVERRIAKHNVRAPEHNAIPYPPFSFIDEERAAGRLTNQPRAAD